MADACRKADRAACEEPPETPAHLFAVKAFKTALFGTPAPAPTVKPKKIAEASKAAVPKQPEPDRDHAAASGKDDGTSSMDYRKAELGASPAKGILLTPGTAPAKRKTVSFSEMASKHRDVKPREAESPTRERSAPVDQINVRRKLFQDTEQQDIQALRKEVPHVSDAGGRLGASNAPRATQTPAQENERASQTKSKAIEREPEAQPDITVDMDQPRSRSGKHWMQEYQREHDSSKVEMKNLIRHNKVTRSFAEKRDQEATEFAEKLEEAETKLKEMEQRVSGLAGQLMDERTQDNKQEEILNELATQTAQALRYKQKAERYRAALWGDEGGKREGSKRAEENHLNVKSLESDEISALRAEVANLKVSKRDAEQRASKLVLENAGLKEDLAKADKELARLRAQSRLLQQRPSEDHLAEVQRVEEKLDQALQRNRDLSKKIELLEEGGARKAGKQLDTDLSRPRPGTVKVAIKSHLDAFFPDAGLASSSKRRRISDLEVPRNDPVSTTKSRSRGTPVPAGRERRANLLEEPTLDSTAEAPRIRRSTGASRAEATASPRQPSRKRSALVPDHDQRTDLSGPAPEPLTPLADLPSHRPSRQEVASGRRSPIIPESARGRELRHAQSTSSLTPGSRWRTAGDSSLGVVSGNVRTGLRAGRSELPADRVAAAKKRLEEKAAKRAARGAGKENVQPE